MTDTTTPNMDANELALIERRFNRERSARKEAENLLNAKSLDLYHALQRTSDAQRQLELALWASGESIWEWRAVEDSLQFRTFTSAHGDAKMSLMHFTDLLMRVHPDDTAATSLTWAMHLAGGNDSLDFLIRYLVNEQWRWLRVRGQAVARNAEGWAERLVGTVKDVTLQLEAEEALRLMASAFASSRDAMVVMTEQWQIIEANQAFSELTFSGTQTLVGDTFSRFVDLPEAMLGRLRQKGFAQAETLLQLGRGRKIPVEISVNCFAATAGNAPYLIATLRDITERHQAAIALERLAKQDAVTQLPNRHALQKALEARLASVSESAPLAVMFIDLDNFKGINDSLGHDAGDILLKVVAGRLLSELSSRDILARWGGDEFVALVDGAESIGRLDKLVQRLLQVLRQPLSIDGYLAGISASIGIALAPEDGEDVSTLLRRADVAMYAAKNAGRDQAVRYHPELDSDGLHRMTLTGLLRQAVAKQELTFVAQPKVRFDGEMVGCELLVRWHTVEYGMVSPVSFIPIAEETGLILPIGHQAIREAVSLVQRLDSLNMPISVAVNLSPLQFRDPNLESILVEACRQAGVAPSRLQLEVTESAFLDNKQTTETLLWSLKERGFTLALDDFGTGYSSLSYLRDLPFDVVKIDRAFLRDVDRDARSARLLAGIVDLCHALGMEIVAEGIETASQLKVLETLGIVEYQGFYFHRPMAQADLLALAAAQQAEKTKRP